MNLTLNDARGFPSYVVSVTSEGKEVANHSTHSTSVVVGGLMPHTEYNITVQALTAGGTKEGPLSAPGETERCTTYARVVQHYEFIQFQLIRECKQKEHYAQHSWLSTRQQ